MWRCGWSKESGRCIRFHCRKDGPCDGYPDDPETIAQRNARLGLNYWRPRIDDGEKLRPNAKEPK